MNLFQKTGFAVLLILFLSVQARAQSSAGFTIAATIVSPVGLMSGAAGVYSAVTANSKNLQSTGGNYEMHVAAFKVEAATADVYSITIPAELALKNASGNSCITALINTGFTAQLLPGGQKQVNINGDLVLTQGGERGRHSTMPFEVTVNFN